MALRPGEDALALENVVDELAAVGASVRVDRHAQAVLHVVRHFALILAPVAVQDGAEAVELALEPVAQEHVPVGSD